MANEITSTADLAESEWDGHSEPGEVDSDIVATVEPEGRGIEFHVSMRSYTQRDMGDLIIEAAARQLVGRNASDGALAKAVQDAAIRQITARADEKLAAVAADIIDQPVLSGPLSSKEPVTMREMIGLYAKEYLTEKVGHDGKFDDSYHGRNSNKARITWIVERALDSKFKSEIEKATSAAITEIQAAIREQHKAVLAAETARIRDAIAEAVQS